MANDLDESLTQIEQKIDELKERVVFFTDRGDLEEARWFFKQVKFAMLLQNELLRQKFEEGLEENRQFRAYLIEQLQE